MRSGTMKEKLKVKGTIYVDRSRKGKTKAGTPKLREIFRAEVSYGGKRYRFRSSDYETCIAFLEMLADRYSSMEPYPPRN